METEFRNCECGRTWKLTRLRTLYGLRNDYWLSCSCGRALTRWDGVHMWTTEELLPPTTLHRRSRNGRPSANHKKVSSSSTHQQTKPCIDSATVEVQFDPEHIRHSARTGLWVGLRLARVAAASPEKTLGKRISPNGPGSAAPARLRPVCHH